MSRLQLWDTELCASGRNSNSLKLYVKCFRDKKIGCVLPTLAHFKAEGEGICVDVCPCRLGYGHPNKYYYT